MRIGVGVLVACLCAGAAGCNVEGVLLGYPVEIDTAVPDLFDDEDADCAPEVEPNDNENAYEIDWVGLITDEREAVLCGRIDKAGLDGNGYFNGDFDYIWFEVLETRQIEVEVDSRSSDTDLDLFLAVPNSDEWANDYDYDSDAEVSLRIPAGFGYALVLGKSGPAADYVLTIRAR